MNPASQSGAARHLPSAHQQREIDAAASEWVVRRHAGMDPTAESELARWLQADPAHEDAFARLSAMAAVFQRAQEKGVKHSILTQLEVRSRRRRSRRKIAAGAAAVALLAAIWFRPIFVQRMETPPTVAGSAETIRRLPDGSIVELNQGAEIALHYEPSFRRVTLVRGEALFRVQKNPSRPFIVQASGVEVRAVGTAFKVLLDASAVEVKVTEGMVRVADAANGESLLPRLASGEIPVLSAGDRVVIDLAPLLARASPAPAEAVRSSEASPTVATGISNLTFDGVELVRAVAQMNRANRIQIVLGDDSLEDLHVSGTFRPDSPDGFARMIAASFGLQIERRGDNIVLSRNDTAKK